MLKSRTRVLNSLIVCLILMRRMLGSSLIVLMVRLKVNSLVFVVVGLCLMRILI